MRSVLCERHLKRRGSGRGPAEFGSWDGPNLVAPHVPASAAVYALSDLACDPEYDALAAWHENGTGHPRANFLYTLGARVTTDDQVQIAARARQGSSGYAYVDVFVLCRLRQAQ